MADLVGSIGAYLDTIVHNPVYLLVTVGAIALFILAVVAHRIHKIHSQEIFVHQAWGANWKGR